MSIADLRSLMRTAGYDLSKFSGQQSPGAEVFRGFAGGRLVAFSAVGFDEQKTRAMVTVQYDCFPTAVNQPPYRYCHEYQQLMLEKQEGKWVAARGGLLLHPPRQLAGESCSKRRQLGQFEQAVTPLRIVAHAVNLGEEGNVFVDAEIAIETEALRKVPDGVRQLTMIANGIQSQHAH